MLRILGKYESQNDGERIWCHLALVHPGLGKYRNYHCSGVGESCIYVELLLRTGSSPGTLIGLVLVPN